MRKLLGLFALLICAPALAHGPTPIKVDETIVIAADPKAVTVLIGKEFGMPNLEQIGLVFSHWGGDKRGGVVAVMGPARLNYPVVVPQVRHLSQLLTELSSSF